VRDGCPVELSFDEWQSTDPLPEFIDDVTGFGLHSPSGKLVDEPEDHPLRPVHFPDHPAFGPVSAVGVPIPISPLGAEGEISKADSAGDSQPRMFIPVNDSIVEKEDQEVLDEFEVESDISAADFPGIDQSELDGGLEDEILPPLKLEIAQSKIPLSKSLGEPFSLDVGVGQSDCLSRMVFERELDNENKFEETVEALETDSLAPNLSGRDRTNKLWFYEPRMEGQQPDLLAPAFPKRQSKPPQRLTASRLGLVASTAGVLVCSNTPHNPAQSSCSSSREVRTENTSLSLPAGGLHRSAPNDRGDIRRPSSPPASMSEDSHELNRFSVRLQFPNGERPSLVYSVHGGMLVSVLRHRVMTFLEAQHPVHLLVGLSWEHDILEHEGTITDRVFPGTQIPCPYLQQGWNVNVYFTRGEDTQDTTSELMGDSGSNEESAENSSPSEESPNDSSRSNKSQDGKREGDYDLDEMIRDQLAEDHAEDAMRSSCAIAPPRTRREEVLSDREHYSRRMQQEGLFEGYRRVKRLRSDRSWPGTGGDFFHTSCRSIRGL
jgi:hypothetical protein